MFINGGGFQHIDLKIEKTKIHIFSKVNPIFTGWVFYLTKSFAFVPDNCLFLIVGCCNKKKKATGIDKLKSILNGWKNVIWSDPKVEQIAVGRAKICAGCDHNVLSFCNDCGCFIPAKARSLSETCVFWNVIDAKYGL